MQQNNNSPSASRDKTTTYTINDDYQTVQLNEPMDIETDDPTAPTNTILTHVKSMPYKGGRYTGFVNADNIPHGEGTITDIPSRVPSSTVSGFFNNGEINYGTCIYDEGSWHKSYTGPLRNFIPHGPGGTATVLAQPHMDREYHNTVFENGEIKSGFCRNWIDNRRNYNDYEGELEGRLDSRVLIDIKGYGRLEKVRGPLKSTFTGLYNNKVYNGIYKDENLNTTAGPVDLGGIPRGRVIKEYSPTGNNRNAEIDFLEGDFSSAGKFREGIIKHDKNIIIGNNFNPKSHTFQGPVETWVEIEIPRRVEEPFTNYKFPEKGPISLPAKTTLVFKGHYDENGKPINGKITYPNGSTYEGDVTDFIPEGHGRFTSADKKIVMEGFFVIGKAGQKATEGKGNEQYSHLYCNQTNPLTITEKDHKDRIIQKTTYTDYTEIPYKFKSTFEQAPFEPARDLPDDELIIFRQHNEVHGRDPLLLVPNNRLANLIAEYRYPMGPTSQGKNGNLNIQIKRDGTITFQLGDHVHNNPPAELKDIFQFGKDLLKNDTYFEAYEHFKHAVKINDHLSAIDKLYFMSLDEVAPYFLHQHGYVFLPPEAFTPPRFPSPPKQHAPSNIPPQQEPTTIQKDQQKSHSILESFDEATSKIPINPLQVENIDKTVEWLQQKIAASSKSSSTSATDPGQKRASPYDENWSKRQTTSSYNEERKSSRAGSRSPSPYHASSRRNSTSSNSSTDSNSHTRNLIWENIFSSTAQEKGPSKS